MKNKILKNLTYYICAGLGLWNFILLAFPYVVITITGGYISETQGISGYNIMDLWQGGFSGVMSSLIQILLLILAIGMLAYGSMGILKTLGIFNAFPDKLGETPMKKFGDISLYCYAGGNSLLLFFLIIFCAVNSTTEYYTTLSVALGVGIFFTLIFAVGAIVANIILDRKFLSLDENAPFYYYACSKCGKKVKKGVKFCPECGGAVEERQEVMTYFACSKCGKKVKKNVKFCPECGSAVEEKIQGEVAATQTKTE